MEQSGNIVVVVVTHCTEVAAQLLEALTRYPETASNCYSLSPDKEVPVASSGKLQILECFLPLKEGVLFLDFLNTSYPQVQALVFSERPIRTKDNAAYLKVVPQEIPMKSCQFGMN